MPGPIYLLYQVNNFYQNNRKYIQSKSNYQLAGNTIRKYQKAGICAPYVSNEEMGKTLSWGNRTLNSSAVASPCGSIGTALVIQHTHILQIDTQS